MKSKVTINDILLQLKSGASREELNDKYNKATVTKAYNKFLLELDKRSPNQESIEELFKKIFNIVDREGEYEITIKISPRAKKNINFNNKLLAVKGETLINPYDIFYKSGKEVFINELKAKDTEYLVDITKKYFSDRSGKIYKEKDKGKVIDYIVSSMERLLNLGKSFRKSEYE